MQKRFLFCTFMNLIMIFKHIHIFVTFFGTFLKMYHINKNIGLKIKISSVKFLHKIFSTYYNLNSKNRPVNALIYRFKVINVEAKEIGE